MANCNEGADEGLIVKKIYDINLYTTYESQTNYRITACTIV